MGGRAPSRERITGGRATVPLVASTFMGAGKGGSRPARMTGARQRPKPARSRRRPTRRALQSRSVPRQACRRPGGSTPSCSPELDRPSQMSGTRAPKGPSRSRTPTRLAWAWPRPRPSEPHRRSASRNRPTRHGRPWAGHPRLHASPERGVDLRAKPGDDRGLRTEASKGPSPESIDADTTRMGGRAPS